MRYIQLIICTIIVTNTYAQKQRSLSNKEDKEYFLNQLEKIVATKLAIIEGTINRNEVSSFIGKDTDTFYLHVPAQPIDELKTLQGLEQDGVVFPLVFWNELLKEFPQFKIFSLSFPCNKGKIITINYHYNKDGTVSFFSQLQKRWLTIEQHPKNLAPNTNSVLDNKNYQR